MMLPLVSVTSPSVRSGAPAADCLLVGDHDRLRLRERIRLACLGLMERNFLTAPEEARAIVSSVSACSAAASAGAPKSDGLFF